MIDSIKFDKNFGIWCENSVELDDVAYYLCGYKSHRGRSDYFSSAGFIKQKEFIKRYKDCNEFIEYYIQANHIIRKQKLNNIDLCSKSEIL